MIIQKVLEVLVLCVMVEAVIQPRIVDSVYIGMSVSVGKGFSEEGIMPLGVGDVGGIEVF